ncbi:DNA-binding response regulator, OmpR family, contains REC and winged-helix (wHTH) domain [Friedmanniella luteola]|uniref:DNA-binding response regulator, OmpR family, contains REC and winged-helix (WHTH) domain n=1 Tax=Friedmanniella luteola TaxID=546871 RepID=A0A1H1WPR1_9ACTN|nr:response regulator transcription factor [Friedmanniella luteola]SDS98992.1 DNA-binding response regulator, OmpR family, contains REC and winged-helix (wHTH) domain [Friedmanniella luteola]SDT00472.1 DNA-binding response regulator, OmpR family, contains REC and winged-helix (wHTH) domain [Friedmanniella luteola]
MKILLAEDDIRLADLLEQAFVEAGWQVETHHDGPSAYEAALTGRDHDVLLLDWMLPGLDGATISRRLREYGIRTPILMLTARTSLSDRVDGLNAGADDYLAKPFELEELLARIRALHRRAHLDDTEQPLQVGDLALDPLSRRVTRAGQEIELSAREFAILQLLLERAGQVVSRYTILDEVWDGDTDLRSNVIDVHVASLRAKIDRPFDTSTITTRRGAGYRVEPDPR